MGEFPTVQALKPDDVVMWDAAGNRRLKILGRLLPKSLMKVKRWDYSTDETNVQDGLKEGRRGVWMMRWKL